MPKALVYVAALAPDEGETVADVFTRGTPHPQAPKLVSPIRHPRAPKSERESSPERG